MNDIEQKEIGTTEIKEENSLRVGDILRKTREEYGYTLDDMAEILKLKLSHLEAIEDNRIKDLPVGPYSVGFIKSYANFFKLDANDLVEKFKKEAKGLNKTKALSFPEPDSGYGGLEFSNGALILVGVIGLLVLVVLFSRNAKQPPVLDESCPVGKICIPKVPERLSGNATNNNTSVATTNGEGQNWGQAQMDMEKWKTLNPGADALQQAPINSPVDPNMANTAPLNNVAPSPVAAPLTAPIAVAPQPVQVAPAQIVPTQVAVVPLNTTAPTKVLVANIPNNPAALNTVAAPVAAPSPSQVVAPVKTETKVFGAVNIKTRILVRAVRDSWVEIYNEKGKKEYSALLKRGEIYKIPNKTGYKITTGNAGGLEIFVDERLTKPIGVLGEVVKNYSLDADKLKAR